ncbi:protein SFI1 homolog isoform X2 [Antennarius striatus]|uniref:protein SFI1 homolog isoform X2 n=1 Tax=Antennarius striatus TaxID=241820 RepID=UPI0035B29DFF
MCSGGLNNTMQRNIGKSDSGRRSNVTKQVHKVHSRNVPYRVGYSWNKGGKLKELRTRHLARKFLKIWMYNTFGRILPQKAKSHYKSVILRRTFDGWRDEWWTTNREWSLTLRADCHYRYYLCNYAFHSWRTFLLLQRGKKGKMQHAKSFADRHRMRGVWERWKLFAEIRRMNNRMSESALELNRLSVLHSVWCVWRTRLQQRQDIYALEDQLLKQKALTLQSRALLRWKEMYVSACCQKKQAAKAELHFIVRLKRKTIYSWKIYLSHLQAKKKLKSDAQRFNRLRMVMIYWNKWSYALRHKQREENHLQAAGLLAIQIIQRRALGRWKAYMTLCRQKEERNRIASQHSNLHLLRAGLQGFSLNIMWNKTHRLNNHIAVQHCFETVTNKYWKIWQNRLEEAEDESFQPLREMALTKHRMSLLRSFFQDWRQKLVEQRCKQVLEQRADVWFAKRILTQCLSSWVEFTLQRRLSRQRRHKAEVYDQQRQYMWVFYTWWEQSKHQRDQRLSEQMAILHEERHHLQRAWSSWRQRAEQQISETEKQMASDHLYRHRLLCKTVMQWKDNSTEIRDRRNRDQQACYQGDLCCTRWTVDKWKQFVQRQQAKKRRLKQMQHHHEVKLLRHTFVAWKKHHQLILQIYGHAEKLCRQQEQNFLRKVLAVWRKNAALLTKVRLMETKAHNHFNYFLQFKVLVAWRKATADAVLTHHQQREVALTAQRSRNQVRLLESFRQWRRQSRDVQRDRTCMEKATWHHESKLLSTAWKAWNEYHNQYHRNKVMKRQALLLLKLKMYQTYFERWKVKLQHRRREAEHTEQALWHWSFTLQAKVFYGWKLWVTDQRRKRLQAAQAAQIYRDQLLREGVTCILTYAAHMNDLTTSLTQHSQDQRSQHLQRVVKRCAMHWKHRALCKPQREQKVKGQQLKKNVTFCLKTPALRGTTQPDSAEQKDENEEQGKLPEKSSAVTSTQQNPKPSQLGHPEVSFTSTYHNSVISTKSSSKPHMPAMDCTLDTHVLLPSSAFMTTGTKDSEGKTSRDFGEDPLVNPIEQPSAYLDVSLRTTSEEPAVTDPASALIKDLLSIQLDMKAYQQDRKQLRAWQKLKVVLQNWLQTSGKDEQTEKNAVCEELKELEERIDRLSTEVAEQKPTMLLHAERIKHLQTVLTDHSVFSTLEQIALIQQK